MPKLVLASTTQIEAIYRESHALWGAGLHLRDYTALWNEISNLPWAARHARFHAWQADDGQVLSSMKLYRPLIRVAGETARASVLGAIFTPLARRRNGHASQMVRHVIQCCRQRGDRLCLLFSDIGPAFYTELGFHALPAQEHWGRIPRNREAARPSLTMQPLSESEIGSVRQAHNDSCSRRPLALVRDEEHWEFLLARTAGFFRRLRDRMIGSRFSVVKRDGRFAGYLITVEGRGEWNLREVGAVGGDPETMVAILDLGAQRARGEGLRRFYGWLPPELPHRLENWEIRSQSRRRALPMVLPLSGSIRPELLQDPETAFIPYQDQF
jgi:GNAT superfamily N-acetyltransferase